MKRILILAFFLSTSAIAETWVSPNKGGGEIVITTAKCPADPSIFQGYSYNESGRAYWFCWVLTGDRIMAVYEDGKTYAYDANRFFRKTDGKPAGKAL